MNLLETTSACELRSQILGSRLQQNAWLFFFYLFFLAFNFSLVLHRAL